MHNWLRCQGLGKPQDETLAVLAHDMYVIGTQESALTEKDWVNRLQRTLSECVQTDLQLVRTIAHFIIILKKFNIAWNFISILKFTWNFIIRFNWKIEWIVIFWEKYL